MQPEITLSEAQRIVDQWINTIGIRYYNELTNTAVLMEEVGEVAVMLARNGYITGQTYNVNGGWYMS